MIDPKTRDSLLNQLALSKEFQHADKYLELLHYLLAMAQKGHRPKERDIARDVLQKERDFDPLVDTSVRVYMYRLRKKLENYYQNEGLGSDLQLAIPKGEYFIELKHAEVLEKQRNPHFNLKLAICAVVIVLLLTTIFYLWDSNQAFKASLRTIPASDEIWGPFLRNGVPTLLVLGDHFFYASRENDDYATDKHIRFHAINSIQEMQAHVSKNKDPNIKYFKDAELFLDRYCAWSLLDILPIFYGYQQKITLKLASELTWDDFHNYNILFVGSFKTLGILESVFANLHISYELLPLPNKIIIKDSLMNPSRTVQTFISRTQPFFQREYSFVAKLPGPNNNQLLLLIGFNYIGVENAVRLVTHPELLSDCKRDIRKSLNQLPPYFEVLYEVQGFEKTRMYSNFLTCFRIPSDFSISQP